MTVADYMKEALLEAEKARREGEVAVGAVIVKNGEIIARAHNVCEARKDATAHAEMEAVKMASAATGDWRLDGCTLYVTLQPCAMCAGAVKNARISRVVFGAYDPKESASLSCDARGGVLESECTEVLRATFDYKRR